MTEVIVILSMLVAFFTFAFQFDNEIFNETTITKNKQFEMNGHLYRCNYSENDAKFQEARLLKDEAEMDAKELSDAK